MAKKSKLQAPPIEYQRAGAQGDLVVRAGRTCPTCGRAWDRLAIRVCRKCGQVIGTRDKWQMVPAGPGLFALEHHDCANPQARVLQTPKPADPTIPAPTSDGVRHHGYDDDFEQPNTDAEGVHAEPGEHVLRDGDHS